MTKGWNRTEARKMEIGHSAEELGHIFSIATGPAFFLGAIAAFLSLMLGRLNSVLARFKEIGSRDGSRHVTSDQQDEVEHLQKRVSTLTKAIYIAVGGGVCTLALLALMGFGASFKIQQLYGGGLLFLIANCLVAGSLVMFALDVRRDIQRSSTTSA
jgi:Protein of unknown function (DUF2721)